MATGVNGLDIHYLEAGWETPGRPTLLLLHGFPELAYSWRKVMPRLAKAGYRVIAPDQRGYGWTTGWDDRYDGDLASFRVLNLVRDMLGLLAWLGIERTAGVVGHDFGSRVAAWSALTRPDLFPAVALMSAPFGGPPTLPLGRARPAEDMIHDDLAALERPRKHYQWHYATRHANREMTRSPEGLHAFLRAYYHHKSADWLQNKPYRLSGWTAEALSELPTYYIMDLGEGMAETVAKEAPPADLIASCKWLSENELRVYSEAYGRNGFQGGLQWYRCGIEPKFAAELQVFSGRAIEPPCCFISGASDWGVYQKPGELEAMEEGRSCRNFRGVHLIEGAGHWVQQERPEETGQLLIDFFRPATL